MCIYCSIIPKDVLLKLSEDKSLPEDTRKALVETAKLDSEIRRIRQQSLNLTKLTLAMAPAIAAPAGPPSVTVFDCNHSQILPGTPIGAPQSSPDQTVKRTYDLTTKVAKFYESEFGRNSIDDRGMTLMSSVHYGVQYNNAFWNGFQMAYGDGDGRLFLDFTKGDDVVCHELTHGVTQYSLQLNYTGEAGGLNESMSDVFGSMFRQWNAKEDVNAADWLIGKDIIGPSATAKGVTCLRDMANPAAKHCLAPQIKHFKNFQSGMDPHESSGVPNLAFYQAAKAIGGKSWERTGQIWYRAMTGFTPSPSMKMKAFANRTRTLAKQLYQTDPSVFKAVDAAWKKVGL